MEDAAPQIGNQPADFESAIAATKFGKFNILLLCLTLPVACVPMFETTTMSYVFPLAQCHLNLSLVDKGYLNAYTFLGMITSGFFWGFLCDTLGRKKILIAGYSIYLVIIMASSLSQNYSYLATTKYFGGFIVNGPFSAMTSYLSEFHASKYRTRAQLVRGMNTSFGSLILSLIAWLILPLKINIVLFDYIVLHAWNIFLMITAFPTVICLCIFIFMPESPKFLMTTGKNEEALKVFQMVFSLNTGKSKDLYPITELIDETKLIRRGSKYGGQVTPNRTKKQAIKEGCRQIRPICFPPFLKEIVVTCVLQGLCMMGMNTLRLWIPQLFQSINDFKYFHNGSGASLCTMIKMVEIRETKKFTNGTCEVHKSPQVYINTSVIAAATTIAFIFALLVVRKIGKKIMLCVLPIIAGASSLSLYFARNSETTLALASIYLSLGSICLHCTLSVVIDLFPTTLRTVAVALVMISGRLATVIGNVVFPHLLKRECAFPFSTLTVIAIASSAVALLLPNTEKRDFE